LKPLFSGRKQLAWREIGNNKKEKKSPDAFILCPAQPFSLPKNTFFDVSDTLPSLDKNMRKQSIDTVRRKRSFCINFLK
jgi:hypothetical protein